MNKTGVKNDIPWYLRDSQSHGSTRVNEPYGASGVLADIHVSNFCKLGIFVTLVLFQVFIS